MENYCTSRLFVMRICDLLEQNIIRCLRCGEDMERVLADYQSEARALMVGRLFVPFLSWPKSGEVD